MKKATSSLTPKRLRLILSISIVLLIAASAGAFILFRGELIAFAQKVHSDTLAADVSSKDVAALERLGKELDESTVSINRAKSIVADSQQYQYQNQIVNDLNGFARTAGLAIANYSFLSDNAGAPGATGTTPADPNAATAAPAVAGLKTTGVSIALRTPANYKAVMRFVNLIEQNLTKMQLTGISLSASSGQSGVSPNDVVVTPLTIEVYIK